MTKRARNKAPRATPSLTDRIGPRWGGARDGAGRPRSRAVASEPHKTRHGVSAHDPIAITARMVDAIRRLDASRIHDALARAIDRALAREDFRIIHLAPRKRRLELIVEATDKLALARGMQGFQVSAARALNRAARRRGTVFPDRYRALVIASRPALRAAIDALPRGARTRIATPQSVLFEG